MNNGSYVGESIDIKTLSTPETVRLRPSMYLGSVDVQSLTRVFEESLCLSASTVSKEFPVVNVKATIARVAEEFIVVEDDGPGICTDVWKGDKTYPDLLMTELFACRDQKIDHESSTFCKVGMAVVNALSSTCYLEIKKGDRISLYLYEAGKLLMSKEISSVLYSPLGDVELGPKSKTGNRLVIKLDQSIFGKHSFDLSALKAAAKSAEATVPGLRIEVGELIQ